MVLHKLDERMWLFCLVIVFLAIAGPMASDMYAPALPEQVKAFMTSSESVKMGLSISLIMSFIGLVAYGALSDCWGRKRILFFGLSLGLIGLIICWRAPSIHVFYIGRIAQGLGFSAAPAVLPAMTRDLFEGKRLAQAASIVSVALGFSPLFAPVLGGYIDMTYGWRMIFLFLSTYVVLCIGVMNLLPETHTQEKRSPLQLKAMVDTYRHIIRDANFMRNMFSKSMAFACFIIFYTVTPFMLENQLHLTAVQYGWITLGLTGAILLSKSANTLLLNFVNVERLIFYSNCSLLLASGLMLIFACFHYYSVYTIMIPFALLGIGCGFLLSNTTAASFKSFNGISSGSVSGLLNGMQRLCAYVGSIIAAHLVITSLLPLALLLTGVSAFSVGQYWWFSRRLSQQ